MLRRTNNEISEKLRTEISVRKGCGLSPLQFSEEIDDAVKKQKKGWGNFSWDTEHRGYKNSRTDRWWYDCAGRFSRTPQL